MGNISLESVKPLIIIKSHIKMGKLLSRNPEQKDLKKLIDETLQANRDLTCCLSEFISRKKMEKLLSFFVLLKGPALTHH